MANIIELAKTILAQVEIVNASLKTAGQPDLSLETDGGQIPPTDPEAQMAKEVAKGAAQQLIKLLGGPMGQVQDIGLAEFDLAAIQVIQRFQIARSFSVGETTTFVEIARKCAIPENQVRRILRYAMTAGIFVELEPGIIAHTAMSKALAQDEGVRAEAAQIVDEQFPASAHLAESLHNFGDSQEGTEAGWAIANRSSKSMFAELQDKYPARAQQFSRFMDLWATQHPTQPLVECIDWKTIATTSKNVAPHVVDIGGGKGHVCGALAEALPDYQFTVQDYPDTVGDASAVLPLAVRDRVSYQGYDFMTSPQPCHGADVYFFRSVFHDWPDKYCVQILRNLIPALRPGARIVLNELCLTSTPLIPPLQRITRALDMVMLSLFNGQERSKEDFIGLFAQADPRFEFVGIIEPSLNAVGIPEKGLLSILEAVWKGEESNLMS